MNNEIYLEYIGKGASLPDVPAKNLSYEEAKRFDIVKLIQSGLYKYTGEYAITEETKQGLPKIQKKAIRKRSVKNG